MREICINTDLHVIVIGIVFIVHFKIMIALDWVESFLPQLIESSVHYVYAVENGQVVNLLHSWYMNSQHNHCTDDISEFHICISITDTDKFDNEKNFIIGKISVLEYGLVIRYPLQLPSNHCQTMVQNNFRCAVHYQQMYDIWNLMCLCAWHKFKRNNNCAPNKRWLVKHVANCWAEIPCLNFQFQQ